MLTLILTSLAFQLPPNFTEVDPPESHTKVQKAYLMEKRDGFVPSLNVVSDPFTGSMDEYLKKMKKENSSNPQNRIYDFGTIKTGCGTGYLYEIDSNCSWGDIKLLQCHVLREGKLYVLTGCALKNDYEKLRFDFINFFSSMKWED